VVDGALDVLHIHHAEASGLREQLTFFRPEADTANIGGNTLACTAWPVLSLPLSVCWLWLPITLTAWTRHII